MYHSFVCSSCKSPLSSYLEKNGNYFCVKCSPNENQADIDYLLSLIKSKDNIKSRIKAALQLTLATNENATMQDLVRDRDGLPLVVSYLEESLSRGDAQFHRALIRLIAALAKGNGTVLCVLTFLTPLSLFFENIQKKNSRKPSSVPETRRR